MVGTMLQMPQKQHLGYRGTVFSIDTEPTFFFSFESRADGTFKIVGLFHLKKEKELKKRQNKITHLTMNSEHGLGCDPAIITEITSFIAKVS